MRGRGELGAGGAAAGGEVEALGVESDRPPGRTRRLVPREPRERRLAQRVHLGDEPLFGLGQRRFALARGEDFRRLERGGAAEAAVEMHVVDPELVKGEIGETSVEASLGIPLQIPNLGARRRRIVRPGRRA